MRIWLSAGPVAHMSDETLLRNVSSHGCREEGGGPSRQLPPMPCHEDCSCLRTKLLRRCGCKTCKNGSEIVYCKGGSTMKGRRRRDHRERTYAQRSPSEACLSLYFQSLCVGSMSACTESSTHVDCRWLRTTALLFK